MGDEILPLLELPDNPPCLGREGTGCEVIFFVCGVMVVLGLFPSPLEVLFVCCRSELEFEVCPSGMIV